MRESRSNSTEAGSCQMTCKLFTNSAILAWIAAFLLMIVSGPMIYKGLALKANNLCSIDDELTELEFFKNCDFKDFKDTAWNFWITVLSSLIFVALVSIVWTILAYFDIPNWGHVIFYFFGVLCSLASCAAMGIFFYGLYNARFNPPKTPWKNLHFVMKNSLTTKFKTDNVYSDDKKSNEWNILFLNFECCGVDPVFGTTNDFDNTTWCTTDGSCQATSSQIPKSCCKSQNEFDYQAAPSDCHASVNPGAYYEKGSYSVVKKEIKKRRKEVHNIFDDFLKSAITVGMFMITYALWLGTLAITSAFIPCCKNCEDPIQTPETNPQVEDRNTSSHGSSAVDTTVGRHQLQPPLENTGNNQWDNARENTRF